MKFSKLIYTTMMAAVLAVPFQVQAESDETALMDLLNSLADNPEQHGAIATYYRDLAATAREEAVLHEKMKERYSTIGGFRGRELATGPRAHCDRIVALQNSLAEEYDALAELHDSVEE